MAASVSTSFAPNSNLWSIIGTDMSRENPVGDKHRRLVRSHRSSLYDRELPGLMRMTPRSVPFLPLCAEAPPMKRPTSSRIGTWNDDKAVDQDWVGGVGAVGRKVLLLRCRSQLAWYPPERCVTVQTYCFTDLPLIRHFSGF